MTDAEHVQQAIRERWEKAVDSEGYVRMDYAMDAQEDIRTLLTLLEEAGREREKARIAEGEAILVLESTEFRFHALTEENGRLRAVLMDIFTTVPSEGDEREVWGMMREKAKAVLRQLGVLKTQQSGRYLSPSELVQVREVLNGLRREHLVVEGDCWFSCPKSGHNCDDSRDKMICDCGADAHNVRLDTILPLLGDDHEEKAS